MINRQQLDTVNGILEKLDSVREALRQLNQTHDDPKYRVPDIRGVEVHKGGTGNFTINNERTPLHDVFNALGAYLVKLLRKEESKCIAALKEWNVDPDKRFADLPEEKFPDEPQPDDTKGRAIEV